MNIISVAGVLLLARVDMTINYVFIKCGGCTGAVGYNYDEERDSAYESFTGGAVELEWIVTHRRMEVFNVDLTWSSL